MRRATLEVCQEIIELLQQSAKWLQQCGVTQWPPDWLLSQVPLVCEQIKLGWVWTARQQGNSQKIIGIVTIREHAEEYWGTVREPTLFLQKLARHRDPVYAGVGKKMLLWLEHEACRRHCQWLRLECLESNTALHRYYEMHGFARTGHVTDHGTPLLLYQKRVSGVFSSSFGLLTGLPG
ncbi:MAG: GNAT family N-acetyltransferase [Magnetococcales bacterium]|nr:GNAT family N-acetyltransferase [Magnetococcales bacterium]